MLPKSFSSTGPQAACLEPGQCSLPLWQLRVWQCYEELQLLISELLQCWWQHCKLILKLTEGTWRGPTAYLGEGGQRKNYHWSWVNVKNTFGKLCLVIKVMGPISTVFGRGICLRKTGDWKIHVKELWLNIFGTLLFYKWFIELIASQKGRINRLLFSFCFKINPIFYKLEILFQSFCCSSGTRHSFVPNHFCFSFQLSVPYSSQCTLVTCTECCVPETRGILHQFVVTITICFSQGFVYLFWACAFYNAEHKRLVL